jgi:UDP-glucuronate 4-epimerase
MAYTYSHLYDIPATGLRFFTVYGPMGRPDMAYYSFTNSYFRGEPIRIFNNGDFENDLYRDFTYIDDIVEGIVRVMEKPPMRSGATAKHRIYNIGNNCPVRLMQFVTTLEKVLSDVLGRDVIFKKAFESNKPGDVKATYASIDLLQEFTGFRPSTPLEDGLKRFAEWYVEHYKVR